MRESRYPNGYAPKIEYYQYKLTGAVQELNFDNIAFYTKKLEYFVGREAQRLERLAQLVD